MSKGIFGGKIFGNKKKIKTIPIKRSNTITRSCPVIYQGILMGHTDSIEKIIDSVMEIEEYGFSQEEMVATVKFFDKKNAVYYLLVKGRNIEAAPQSYGYSKSYAYKLNGKYEVNVQLAIFVKNDTKGGGETRSKSFYDKVMKKFCSENSIS